MRWLVPCLGVDVLRKVRDRGSNGGVIPHKAQKNLILTEDEERFLRANVLSMYANEVVAITTYATASQMLISKASHFMLLNSSHPKGNTSIPPNRNTHFITVMVLYFCIRGLTIIRNTPHDIELIKIIKSPAADAELNDTFSPHRSNRQAPVIPITIPLTLRKVMASRIKSEATTSTIIGLVVIISEALMGEVRSRPLKKSNWLVATPNTAHTNNLNKSLFSTFSRVIRELIRKKTIAVNNTRIKINPKG